MRFTDSKRRMPLVLIILVVVVLGVLALGFCQFGPTPKTVQKTIVFEAD